MEFSKLWETKMYSIETAARNKHGDRLYELTWRARNETDLSKKNWLWALLALRVSMYYIVFFFLSYVVYKIFQHPASPTAFYIYTFLVVLAFVLIEGFLVPQKSIESASSFYAIAADMKRTGQRGFFPRLLYFFSGSMSVLLAMLVMSMSFGKVKRFTSTELDVLGSILSKAGRWNMAKKIYDQLSKLYADRFTKGTETAYQLSISFGLACKWMLDSPYYKGNRKILKFMMLEIVREYPDMPAEVSMRFREVLGMDMDIVLNRVKDLRYQKN